MTDSTGPGPGIPSEASAPVHAMVRTGLRALGTTAVLVAIYYLLPLDHTSTWIAATTLVIGLVTLIALVIFQVRSIIRSRFPGLRAVEALATSLPLFLLLFSATYLVMATVSVSNFGQKLTHTDALYFTVTAFTTVGFGDIAAKSGGARLLVTGQMITDLIILGIGAKIILGAVTRGRQRQPRNTDTGNPASSSPGGPQLTRRPLPAEARTSTPTDAGKGAKTNGQSSDSGMACEVYVSAPPTSCTTVNRRATSTGEDAKVFMTELGHGAAALLGDWMTYALVAQAIMGFVLQPPALRTDVLASAMASSNAVTLFVSVIFGLTVFGESLSHGHGQLAPAIIGLAFALIGIVLLAGAKPPLAAEPIPGTRHA